MRKSIIAVDNFYSDPSSVIAYAIRQKYYFPYDDDHDVVDKKKDFHWKASWFKSANQCPFKSSELLIKKLEEITGDEIDRVHWNSDFPIAKDGKGIPEDGMGNPADFPNSYSCLWNCSFHLKNDVGQQLGDGVHSHVTDRWNSVGINGWAGVIYLNPYAPIHGGLNLWRNANPAKNFDWMTPKENWIQLDSLGNIFNRLILVRGNMPHSGANGWGPDLKTGRLYQTFFFKIIEKENTDNGVKVVTVS